MPRDVPYPRDDLAWLARGLTLDAWTPAALHEDAAPHVPHLVLSIEAASFTAHEIAAFEPGEPVPPTRAGAFDSPQGPLVFPDVPPWVVRALAECRGETVRAFAKALGHNFPAPVEATAQFKEFLDDPRNLPSRRGFEHLVSRYADLGVRTDGRDRRLLTVLDVGLAVEAPIARTAAGGNAPEDWGRISSALNQPAVTEGLPGGNGMAFAILRGMRDEVLERVADQATDQSHVP